MFDRLIWHEDRMLLDDLVFRIEQAGQGEGGEGDHFRFYKLKGLVDQYEAFFRERPGFRPDSIVEIGIWDGASVAFWHELFRPRKHVAIDHLDRRDSDYFRRYVEGRGIGDRLRTIWKFDQADKRRFRDLLDAEFDRPLNLVIDDGSHLYAPTLASFEALFPAIAPGGWYLIEDWAWEHWPEFGVAEHPWAKEPSLTRLVCELVEAAGSSSQLIKRIVVFQGFVSIERGPKMITDVGSFSLEREIVRRAPRGLVASLCRRLGLR